MAMTSMKKTLERIFANEKRSKQFREYLQERYAEESYDFYIAVLSLEGLTNEKEIQKIVKKIWNEFVSTDAPNVINIPGPTFERVRDKFESGNLTKNIFQECKDHVARTLSSVVIVFDSEIPAEVTIVEGEKSTKTPKKTLEKKQNSLSNITRKKAYSGSSSSEGAPSAIQKKKSDKLTKNALKNHVPALEDMFTDPSLYRDFNYYLKQLRSADYLHFIYDVKEFKRRKFTNQENMGTYIKAIIVKYLGEDIEIFSEPLLYFEDITLKNFIENYKNGKYSLMIFDRMYDEVYEILNSCWVKFVADLQNPVKESKSPKSGKKLKTKSKSLTKISKDLKEEEEKKKKEKREKRKTRETRETRETGETGET